MTKIRDTQEDRSIGALLNRVTAFKEQQDAPPRNAGAALRLALGWMTGLTFSEASTVVGIGEDNLRRILHGKLSVAGSRVDRLDKTLEMLYLLRQIVPEDLLAEWFRRPVPALGDQTPLEALRKRRVNDVLATVRSYFDPTFS